MNFWKPLCPIMHCQVSYLISSPFLFLFLFLFPFFLSSFSIYRWPTKGHHFKLNRKNDLSLLSLPFNCPTCHVTSDGCFSFFFFFFFLYFSFLCFCTFSLLEEDTSQPNNSSTPTNLATQSSSRECADIRPCAHHAPPQICAHNSPFVPLLQSMWAFLESSFKELSKSTHFSR